MSFTASHFRKLSTDPRAQVWPCTQSAVFTVTSLGGAGLQTIEVQETPFVAHQGWLLGAFNVLSFAIKKDQFGGALRVDIDPGNGVFYQAFIFPLTGELIVDTLTGFEIGGLCAHFIFVNGQGLPTIGTGWIQLRSW